MIRHTSIYCSERHMIYDANSWKLIPPCNRFQHEECSIEVFESILDEELILRDGGPCKTVRQLFAEQELGDKEISMIKDLIRGKPPSDGNPEDHFLYQVCCSLDETHFYSAPEHKESSLLSIKKEGRNNV